MIIGFSTLGFATLRNQFVLLLIVFSALFIGYLFLIKNFKFTFKKAVIIALLFRLCFLASTPVLSDDYFRFIWDGRILSSGNNPYLILPQDLSAEELEIINNVDLQDEVYKGLNSKQYYSVYPPINQLLFAIPAILGNNNVKLEIILLRLLIIAFEVGTFFLLFKLLKHYNQNPSKLLIYAFNPLVIVELTGNLHFEGVVLFFGLLAVWFWIRHLKILSPIALSIAIGVKLIPLMLLPILLRKIRLSSAFLYGGTVLGLVVLYFFPFLNDKLISNFSSSIDLYFRNFEFNASIFYLVRAGGYYLVDYDIIQKAGPILSIIVLFTIVGISLQQKLFSKNVLEKALILLTIYYLFATTVHPWYITTLVGLSVFVNYRYAIIWSYLVILSYSHYWNGEFQENYLLIFIEYLLLFSVILIDVWYSSKPAMNNKNES